MGPQPPPDALLVSLLQYKLDQVDGSGPGCVVLGLPTSVSQFGLLQNEIAPLRVPAPIPPPPPSRLAPPPAAPEPLPLDLAKGQADKRNGALTYLRLHCERSEALRRVKGQLHDPEDQVGGQRFNEEADPVPEDSVAAGRLEPLDGGPDAMALLMQRYAAYWGEKAALDTYMSRLGSMVLEVPVASLICLRARYAISGTDLAHGAARPTGVWRR